MWNQLYQAARKVQNGRIISPFIEAGGVAAAILTKQGQAVTITYEEFPKEEWQEKVVKAQVEPIADKLYINRGEKLYK